MTETVAPLAAKLPNAEEIALIKKFLNDTTLFLGPDPEIMKNHDLMPRTALEEECIAQVSDAHTVAKIRDRIQAGCDEGFEMVEQMGAAPAPSGATSSPACTPLRATWRLPAPVAC